MKLEVDFALRFGMLDGDAVVHSERAVYDPQSAFSPELFGRNESTARRIAIVANRFEGAHFTGYSNDACWIAKRLLDLAQVEVVVIKNGARGAVVATSTDVKTIPAYETNRVWPIGTGDVFSAFFAHFWMEQDLSALQAADKASRAAAVYSNSGALPIPADFETEFEFSAVQVPTDGNPRRIYLAGPFFTLPQRWLIDETRFHLRVDGIEVFSPLHENGQGSAHEIYGPDIEGLEKSQVVFACLDGHDPGTLFEVGYARSKGIPVVAFSEVESEGDLKMVKGSNCEVFHDYCTAIHKAIWEAYRQEAYPQ